MVDATISSGRCAIWPAWAAPAARAPGRTISWHRPSAAKFPPQRNRVPEQAEQEGGPDRDDRPDDAPVDELRDHEHRARHRDRDEPHPPEREPVRRPDQVLLVAVAEAQPVVRAR